MKNSTDFLAQKRFLIISKFVIDMNNLVIGAYVQQIIQISHFVFVKLHAHPILKLLT